MARSDFETLLSLDSYARIIGVDPRHFNQMYCEAFPDRRGEDLVWFQDHWPQPGRASRDDVALAIAEAEELIVEVLGYWVAPKYVVDESHIYPERPYKPMNYNRYQVGLEHLKFIAGGCRTVALIEEDVDISSSYVDLDGDGWDEQILFTVTHADAASWQADEIGIFPPGSDTEVINQIRGLKISISGTTITVRGQSAQFVLPELWNTYQGIDGDDPTVFLQTVDVHRIYTSSSETLPPVRYIFRDDTVYPPQAITYGILEETMPDRGVVETIPATWDGATWTISAVSCSILKKPERIMLNYLSGHPLLRGEVHPKLSRAIAALATARLTSPITGGGESINKIYYEWQRPAIEANYAQNICPFGDRNGAWIAWQIVHTMFGSSNSFSL